MAVRRPSALGDLRRSHAPAYVGEVCAEEVKLRVPADTGRGNNNRSRSGATYPRKILLIKNNINMQVGNQPHHKNILPKTLQIN